MLSYGLSLQHQGRMDEAIEVFRAIAGAFRNPALHQFLVFALFYDRDRIQAVYDEARRWADLYAAPLHPRHLDFGNPRTLNRRLRVGYFAPSFTRSQAAQFMMPVLDSHDPDAVEVFLYCADASKEDGLPAYCRSARSARNPTSAWWPGCGSTAWISWSTCGVTIPAVG